MKKLLLLLCFFTLSCSHFSVEKKEKRADIHQRWQIESKGDLKKKGEPRDYYETKKNGLNYIRD